MLLFLLAVIVPPFINIGRFRRSIIRSVSAGLGRPVEARAVELQLFPLPGFVLHNLTISEDPAFGAEPVMTAETVTAILRPSTLWHARVEIATLRFDTPSVNLVRNAQGRWNFESLLRNSPALQRRKGTAYSTPMPFPYVEATDARINFKFGAEKLPFSLEQANLALWKESRHDWHMRIKARPVRTDLTVEDAGDIRGEGELRTGGMLMNAPIRGSLRWRRVQLGEISRLLHGEDDGWRGTVDWTARATGTLADATVVSDIGVDEFRRAEFVPASEMDLSAHCKARYVRGNRGLDSIECAAPVGDGRLLLRGHLAGQVGSENGAVLAGGSSIAKRGRNRHRTEAPVLPRKPAGLVQITLQHAPAGFFLDLLGHIHPGVAADASVSGQVNGHSNCDWADETSLRLDSLQACTGEFRSTDLRLKLAHLDRPLTIAPLLLVSSPDQSGPQTSWELMPVHVSLGAATPATITGDMTAAGSALQITGSADLAELAKLAQSLKIPAISGEVQSIRGSAQLALLSESTWLPHSEPTGPTEVAGAIQDTSSVQPFAPAELAPSRWTGSLQIQNATLKLAALPLAIQLASARVNISPAGVEWTDLNGTLAHVPFDGSIQWQTPCPAANSACARSFTLHTSDLNASRLQAELRGNTSSLLHLIQPWAGESPQVPEIFGTLNADVLSAGRISMKNATLKLRLQGHQAELLAISGRIFGGTFSGLESHPVANAPATNGMMQSDVGSMQWGNGAPVYTLRAKLENIEPDSVAAIWNEQWGPGTAGMQIDLKTQGWSAADLAQNASGKFSIVWRNGSFTPAAGALADAETEAESFQRWDAKGIIRDRKLVLNSSRMVPQRNYRPVGSPRPSVLPGAAQSVTGTITFARILDLHLTPSRITITGPLSKPDISYPVKLRTVEDGSSAATDAPETSPPH